MNKVISSISFGFAALSMVFMIAAPVMAADSFNLPVTATVVGQCKFSSAPGPVALTLDASVGGPVIQTGSINFWCTKGASWAIVPDSTNGTGLVGSLISAGTPAETIAYSIDTLVKDTGTGLGKSTTETFSLNVNVLEANYIDAAALSDYGDTIVLTMTP